MTETSEFPWDHTDRFWGRGIHMACSPDDARSLITALTEALGDVDEERQAPEVSASATHEPHSAWRSAIDSTTRGAGASPALSVSVTDGLNTPLEISADMDHHAKVRDVIVAAVGDYEPGLHDADPARLVAADRDRIRMAVVDAQLPPDQIADVYREATIAADATRDHRWVEAGFRYEADHQRQADRNEALDASFGLAAEESGRQSGRGWSL